MNAKKFLNAVGQINDEYIVKYAEVSPAVIEGNAKRERNKKKWSAVWLSAAAAVLVLGIGVFISYFIKAVQSNLINSGINVELPTVKPTDITAVKTDAPMITDEPLNSFTCSILELKSDTLGESGFTHHADIDSEVIRTVDESKVGTQKSFTFLGKTYNSVYLKTIEYVFGNVTVDWYKLIDCESLYDKSEPCAVFLPDGELYALVNTPVLRLEGVDKHTNAAKVRAKLENLISGEFELSSFEYFKYMDTLMSAPDSTLEKEGFGTYFFEWYNMKNGLETEECLGFRINEDGIVSSVIMHYNNRLGLENVGEDVTLDSVMPYIEEKLNSIYGDALTGYEMIDAVWTNVGGYPAIKCTVGVSYQNAMGVEWGSTAVRLAVVINTDAGK